MEELFVRFGQMTRWQIRDFAHDLPEWRDPQVGAMPISVADILKSQNKNAKEIRLVESELAGLEQVDCYLAMR